MEETAKLSVMDQIPFTQNICVCAIGVFDGVHIGHQALLEAMVEDAKALEAQPVVVTFNRDPDELFRPEQVHKLLTNNERIAMLESIVPSVLPLRFDRELASLSWQEFLDLLLEFLPNLKAIHVGENFWCGAKASGGIPEITGWGNEHGIKVVAEHLFLWDGGPVSASHIRLLLEYGEVRQAANLLSRPFSLSGRVVHGAGRGAGFGFATANVEADGHFAKLGPYVYACYASIDNKKYRAAVSIGKPPTFSPETQEFDPFLFEVHLIGYEGDLYDQELRMEFVENLRPMRRFDSQEELIATVKKNIAWVEENL